MVEYYRYLWSTTWPSLSVLLLIWVFVLSRLAWKSLKIFQHSFGGWDIVRMAWRLLIWSAILVLYTRLLLLSQPDWFAQPGYFQGLVQMTSYNESSKNYVLEVQDGSEKKQFYVDKNVFEQLKLNQQVKLMFLPIRREVVRCELIESLQ